MDDRRSVELRHGTKANETRTEIGQGGVLQRLFVRPEQSAVLEVARLARIYRSSANGTCDEVSPTLINVVDFRRRSVGCIRHTYEYADVFYVEEEKKSDG